MRNDPNSTLSQNNAKAMSRPEVLKIRAEQLRQRCQCHGFTVPQAQIRFFDYLLPYFSSNELKMEKYISVANTKLDHKYNLEWVRLDVVHESTGLVIEVDGRSHNKKEVKIYDQDRDQVLKDLGYKTYRIRNEDVYDPVVRKNFIKMCLDLVITVENLTI